MREQVIALAKKYRNDETDEEIKNYVTKYYSSMYLLIDGHRLLGYCDYFVVDDTLFIYDLVCEGKLLNMWRYCKGYMKKRRLTKIVFKRRKYGDKDDRTYRRV